MSHLKYLISTFMVVFAFITLTPSTASAQCSPTNTSSLSACKRSCNSCAGPFQGGCKAACRKMTFGPPKDVTCWNGSKAKTLADCPDKPSDVTCWNGSKAKTLADCPDKPTSVTCWNGSKAKTLADCPDKPTSVTCWDGSTAKTLADCPEKPAGTPTCKGFKVVKDNKCVCNVNQVENDAGCCVCAPNHDRIAANNNACMLACTPGQYRDGKHMCVDLPKAPPPPPPVTTDGGDDWLWLVILLCIVVLGLGGKMLHAWLAKRRKEEAEEAIKKGDEFFEKRRYEKASLQYEAALKLVPDHAHARKMQMLCEEKLEGGDDDEAAQARAAKTEVGAGITPGTPDDVAVADNAEAAPALVEIVKIKPPGDKGSE